MDIALLIALILLNGAFAMSEIALVTARKNRLQKLADEGDKSAAIAIRLGDEPTQFLSTVQIGITSIGILNGIVGEAALAGPLAESLQSLGLPQNGSSIAATTLVVVCITYLSIVVGELVPKRLAQSNAEGIARIMARPIALLAQLSRPFVFLLATSTDALLKLFGKNNVDSTELTEDDIHAMLIEGSEAGLIEKQEHEMVRNVFRLDDRRIASLMTPRGDVVFFDTQQSFDDNLQKLIASDHSCFPVCQGSMHEVQGTISAKHLLKLRFTDNSNDTISEYIQAPVYVHESLTGMKLLDQFRESGVLMVFVVDEYGEILGLVTLQDLLEALAGEFKPQDPEDVWAIQHEDGYWLLDGLIPVQELKDRLNLKSVPEEDEGHYNTLSGMMMCLIGTIPLTGNVTEWEGWQLTVVDLDGNRIDKVMARRLPDEQTSEPVDSSSLRSSE